MEKRQIVVLFGDSLLMDTVEAGLEKIKELGVIRIHTSIPDVVQRIEPLSPDLVIFDLDLPNSQFLLPFLRTLPGIPLLGLDVTCSRVIALSSRQYTTLTVHDLARVIHMQTQSQASQRAIEYSLVFNSQGNEFNFN